MKPANTALINLLATGGPFEIADLYTVELVGQPTLYWSGRDIAVSVGGQLYPLGPPIDRTGLTQQSGTQVDTLNLTIYPRYGVDLIGGVSLALFIQLGGFDGALFRLDRAYRAPGTTTWVGTVPMFYGRFGPVNDGDPTAIKLTVNSWLDLLSENVPSDVYQPSCLNTVYDSKCTLSKSANSTTGAVSSGATTTAVPTTISAAAGVYTLGTLTFTSGANNGAWRSVKSQDGSGNLTFAFPLLKVPAAGDTFTIAKGCDRQMATCSGKFGNLINFRGQPFIPIPETAYFG